MILCVSMPREAERKCTGGCLQESHSNPITRKATQSDLPGALHQEHDRRKRRGWILAKFRPLRKLVVYVARPLGLSFGLRKPKKHDSEARQRLAEVLNTAKTEEMVINRFLSL
jgi:hypothetical protein